MAYACYVFAFTFFLFWTPSFWKQAHGASLMVASSLSGILLFFGAITNAVGGWLSDRLFVRTGNLRTARRWVAIPGSAWQRSAWQGEAWPPLLLVPSLSCCLQFRRSSSRQECHGR